ncbi:hypothetical protein [Pseudonocardia aurantiaca]|uniref:Uncharacterized protein n=1 Tax=Pseudonocardia aurantiaca TaxID=75290 RepID=A0ABW4FSW5_9PSEU
MSFSHPGRCRSDAAFAALSGTCPLEASSGRTVRACRSGTLRALGDAAARAPRRRRCRMPQDSLLPGQTGSSTLGGHRRFPR